MNRVRTRQNKRKSMLATLSFALGIIAAVLAVILGSVWIAGLAAVLLIPAMIALYQVGKAISKS
jgi:hypothetical protein